jgi:hypothetical protein
VVVEQAAGPLLSQWENFYVIAGSSAGALTGLQFVVIALMAESEMAGSSKEIRAFGTPTVVHFCAALLVSAIATAPWKTMGGAALALGASGAGGVIYAITVIRHARGQTGYSPDAEDWAWYAFIPLLAYAALFAAAILLEGHPETSLFAVAGVTLLLLFVGIHNSWDTVTYVAMKHRRRRREKKRE